MNYVSSSVANGVDRLRRVLLPAECRTTRWSLMLNAAGYYTLPTQYNVAVALEKAQINMDKSSPDYLLQNLDNVYTRPRSAHLSALVVRLHDRADGVYPSPETKITTAKRQSIADFAYYAICQGQREIGPIGYSPLPVNLVEAAFGQIQKLKEADPAIDLSGLNIETCDNPTFVARPPEHELLGRDRAIAGQRATIGSGVNGNGTPRDSSTTTTTTTTTSTTTTSTTLPKSHVSPRALRRRLPSRERLRPGRRRRLRRCQRSGSTKTTTTTTLPPRAAVAHHHHDDAKPDYYYHYDDDDWRPTTTTTTSPTRSGSTSTNGPIWHPARRIWRHDHDCRKLRPRRLGRPLTGQVIPPRRDWRRPAPRLGVYRGSSSDLAAELAPVAAVLLLASSSFPRSRLPALAEATARRSDDEAPVALVAVPGADTRRHGRPGGSVLGL